MPLPFDPENRRHWYFGDCPADELYFWRNYEYSRECDPLVKAVLNWRQQVDGWQKKLNQGAVFIGVLSFSVQ
jgi:hypothetical protein